MSYNSTVRSGEKLMTFIRCKTWAKTIKIDVLELTTNELHKLKDFTCTSIYLVTETRTVSCQFKIQAFLINAFCPGNKM